MFYILTTIVASNRLHATSRTWKRIANADMDGLIDRVEAEIQNGNGDSDGFKPMWKALLPNILQASAPWEDCQWKALKLIFLKEFNLGTEFDYSYYVSMKIHHKLQHSLHVHPPTWVLIMITSLVFWWFRGEQAFPVIILCRHPSLSDTHCVHMAYLTGTGVCV